MHPAPLFKVHDRAWLIAHLSQYPLCQITSFGQDGKLVCAHAPVLFDAERDVAGFHLSARNPVALALIAGQPAFLVSLGPNCYISPDWYGLDEAGNNNQVPTWNYQSVEIEGTARALTPEQTAIQVNDLSAAFEERLSPKPPWTSAKMTGDSFAKLLNGIVGFEVQPSRFEGINKVSQNKSETFKQRVAQALDALSDPNAEAISAAIKATAPTLP